jgi:hypothetical protein
MTDPAAADAADAINTAPCVEHHLEDACSCCWQAHPGKTQPNSEFSSPEHAADHASRAHFDLLETT